MSEFFNVNTIAFTVLGYPMSYIELFGTLFNVWSVWLVVKGRIATWPIGIVGVLLFLALFYQIQLYADTLEQVYYLGASVYGWWMWSRLTEPSGAKPTALRYSSQRSIATTVGITLALGLALGYVTSQLHVWLPQWFAAAAAYPYIDALTTLMSFTATLLMAKKRIECWVYWILVDVVGIWLYYVKDVKFIALLYCLFLVMATSGLLAWHRQRADLQPVAAA